MSPLSRWLIAAGYLAPLAAVVAFLVLFNVALAVAPIPRDDVTKFRGAMLLFTTMLGALGLSAMLWLTGAATGVHALVKARGRLRWFDYVLLTAGVVPLVVFLAGLVAVLAERLLRG